MVKCRFCEKEILEPKTIKGKVVQWYCDDKCRWNFHNRTRRKFEVFCREFMALLKKHGYLGSK